MTLSMPHIAYNAIGGILFGIIWLLSGAPVLSLRCFIAWAIQAVVWAVVFGRAL